MTEIRFEQGGEDPDAFNLYENGKKIGEMIVEIRHAEMTVYHTEVDEDREGNGFATLLFNEMVSHARLNNLQVLPQCVFVHARFKAHPEQFSDIWKNEH